MRILLSALFLLSLLLPASAKKVTGKVTDANGTAIPYVNIGVRNTSTGTLSGRDGSFSLDVPDSLAHLPLSFSHVSYRPADLPMSDEMQVRLATADYDIAEVTIRPGKAKEKKLSGKGVRIPKTMAVPLSADREIGSIIEVQRDFIVKKIHFQVLGCTVEALLRFNIYRIDGDNTFTNVIRTPIYYSVPVSKETADFSTEPEQLIFLEPGNYYVSIEIVEMGQTHTLAFPLYMKQSYVRDNSMGVMKKQPINIGLSVSGLEYY